MFKQRILGLEIGNSNIKLLECRRKGDKLIIEKANMIKTPAEAISDGIVLDIYKVSNLIAHEIKRHNYRAKNLAVVIKSSQIITRDIRMDKMSPKDTKDILEFQYHEYLLVDISEYQVTYKIVGEVDQEGSVQQEVLIVAAPNKLLNPLIKIADQLKMKVKLININSDAVSNLFHKDSILIDMTEREAMVVDIGGSSTTVTIISGGVGVLSKDVQFGLKELDKMITGQFGSRQIGDLEKFKTKHGAIYENDESKHDQDNIYGKFISKSLKPILEYKLVPGIRRLLQFHFSRGKSIPLEKIYIIGGGASINHIDQYISEFLDIPCTVDIHLDMTKVKADKEVQMNKEYYANILGLISGF